MLYDAYEVQRSLLAGASKLARHGRRMAQQPRQSLGYSSRWGRWSPPALDVFAHASAPRGKPEFGLDQRQDRAARRSRVDEEIVLRKPFGQLKHFARDGVDGRPAAC